MNAILPAEFHKKRHWLPRFDLRSLVVAVTLFCILLGAAMAWYRSQFAEHQRQEKLAELIRQQRGSVVWKSLPAWLSWVPNQAEMLQIVSVHQFLTDSNTDRGVAPAEWLDILEQLRDVPTLRSLSLNERFIDRNLLESLAKLQQLKLVTLRCIAKKPSMGGTPADGVFILPTNFKMTLDHDAVYRELSAANPEAAKAIEDLKAKIHEQLPNVKVDIRIF